MTLSNDCPSFDGCDAPLCLVDKSLESAIWYPDEPICNLRGPKPNWVKTQKKIAKRAQSYTCFTVGMLKVITRVQKGIEGLNPDCPVDRLKIMEKNWIKKRPVISTG